MKIQKIQKMKTRMRTKMMSNSVLLEEALLTSRLNTLQSLTESDLKELDKGITEEDLSALTETFKEDPELLVEFLGTIAGLGGKAAKYLSSKFGSASSAVGGVGKKLNKFSGQKKAAKTKATKKKAFKADQGKSKTAHRDAVVAYGKALKSGDVKARSSALASLKSARDTNRIMHGRTVNPKNKGKSPVTGQKVQTASKKSNDFYKKRLYKRLGECLVELHFQKLNEQKKAK